MPQCTKTSPLKKWLSQFGLEEHDSSAHSPDLNPIQHIWDELEHRLKARPYRPVADLTNVLVAAWEEIPAARFQKLVVSLLRNVEAVITAVYGFRIKCL